MRAVVLRGEALVVEERPDLVALPGEVVVAVESAGLNAADLLQRRGFYPAPAGWPADTPGMEIAGHVHARGDGVTNVEIGQRVCAIVGGGGQATQCVVPANHLLPVPDGVDLASAGGFAEAFTTVYDAFSFAGTMAADCRVLISGAAGGVGSAAVQLAHAWGAHPIGVTRDNRFHQRLLDLGAAEVTVVDDVDQLEPVDFVLELIGAAHFVHAQKVLAPHASVVVIGVSGGSRIELDLLRLMTLRVRMTGSTLRSRSNDEKSVVASGVRREVLPWWSNGAVTVPISANFGIDDVASAYDAFATAGKFGKIVLSMS